MPYYRVLVERREAQFVHHAAPRARCLGDGVACVFSASRMKIKTHRWEEVLPALENMMRAAKRVRAEAGSRGAGSC